MKNFFFAQAFQENVNGTWKVSSTRIMAFLLVLMLCAIGVMHMVNKTDIPEGFVAQIIVLIGGFITKSGFEKVADIKRSDAPAKPAEGQK